MESIVFLFGPRSIWSSAEKALLKLNASYMETTITNGYLTDFVAMFML